MSTTEISKNLTHHEKYTIGVLFCINILNFVDRHCIAGVLLDIQLYFDVDDDIAGLINTGFVVGYTFVSPLVGFLGDRYSRKYIAMVSLAIWTTMGFLNTFTSSIVVFILTRMMVGIGEAGFTVLAPSMIADLVNESSRTLVFALFYFALPVGTGLGFVLSAKANQFFHGQWWWGLRVTPFLNGICFFLLAFGVDPKRGVKDAAALGGTPAKGTSYLEDLRYLFTNKTFILMTIGYTCINFITGALGFWGPKTLSYGIVLIEGEKGTDDGTIVATVGIISIVTGIVGVSIGSGLSKWLRPKYPYVDPLIVSAGLFIATPLYIVNLYFAPINMTLTFVFIFFAQLLLNFNWAIVMDMLMYIVTPTRRASAKAIETFVSHILGNTVSTLLVGVISEAIQDNNDFTSWHNLESDNTTKTDYGETAQNFYGLQFALISIMVVLAFGGFFFIFTSFFIVADKETAAQSSLDKEN